MYVGTDRQDVLGKMNGCDVTLQNLPNINRAQILVGIHAKYLMVLRLHACKNIYNKALFLK